jgi:hypothetical protein
VAPWPGAKLAGLPSIYVGAGNLFLGRIPYRLQKQWVKEGKIDAKVLACSGVVYYYITKSPKHRGDGQN